MGVAWKEEHLDFILVPCGALLMILYHLFHLRTCMNSNSNSSSSSKPNSNNKNKNIDETPIIANDDTSTVIGYENQCKRAWVRSMMKVPLEKRGQATTVIGANITAANTLGSISLTLTSLIGALIGMLYRNDFIAKNVYGNTSDNITYIKYIALLSSFMLAFACFIQTSRCFVHANFLITMPESEVALVNYVERAVIKGSNYWVVGVRALYFSTNLLLWIFGPIPMFGGALTTVLLLVYLDKNRDDPISPQILSNATTQPDQNQNGTSIELPTVKQMV